MKIYYITTQFGELNNKCPRGQDCCVGSIVCKQCPHCYGAGHTYPFGYGKGMVIFPIKDDKYFEWGWKNDWIKCSKVFVNIPCSVKIRRFIYHKLGIPFDKFRTIVIDNGIRDWWISFKSWLKDYGK